MGLNAIVYRNRKHLKLGPDEKAAQLVPETGEVQFENGDLSRKYRPQLLAVQRRLGNTTEISALREEVTRLMGPESVLLQTVLYSGTHSGDTIPVKSVSSLSAELRLIGNISQQSVELRRFVSSIEELIQVAKDEGNPIVFV